MYFFDPIFGVVTASSDEGVQDADDLLPPPGARAGWFDRLVDALARLVAGSHLPIH
jgi:hypothetical protein